MSTLSTTNLKNPSAGSNNIVLGTDGSTRVSTIADSAGANTSTPAEIASGRAKAWVNFNGTGTVAIRASYNVSSITDNGVGDYTVNFTTALADANYSTVINSSRSSVNTTLVNITRLAEELSAPTASAVRIAQGVVDAARALQREDASIISVSIFR
jgi:hypothetical protein